MNQKLYLSVVELQDFQKILLCPGKCNSKNERDRASKCAKKARQGDVGSASRSRASFEERWCERRCSWPRET